LKAGVAQMGFIYHHRYIQQNAVQRKTAQVGQLSEEHRQTLTQMVISASSDQSVKQLPYK